MAELRAREGRSRATNGLMIRKAMRSESETAMIISNRSLTAPFFFLMKRSSKKMGNMNNRKRLFLKRSVMMGIIKSRVGWVQSRFMR